MVVLMDETDKDVEAAAVDGTAALPKGRNDGEGRGAPKLIRLGGLT